MLLAAATTIRLVVGDDFFLRFLSHGKVADTVVGNLLINIGHGVVKHVKEVSCEAPQQRPRPKSNPSRNHRFVVVGGTFRLQRTHVGFIERGAVAIAVSGDGFIDVAKPLEN